MDIIFVFKLLQRKLWLLISLPLIAASVTFFVSRSAPKLYKSSAQMSTGFTTNEEISLSDERISVKDAGTKFSNLIEKMNSPQVMSLVSYDLILHDLKTAAPFRLPRDKDGKAYVLTDQEREKALKIFEAKSKNFELLSSYNQDEKEMIKLLRSCGYSAEVLKKQISIRRVNFTDFLAIDFLSENPELSAFVVNDFMESIIRYEKGIRSDRSSESLEFFTSLMEKKKTELDEKTAALNSFKEQHNVVDYKLESENRLSQITYYELMRDEEFKNVQALRLSLASIEEKLSTVGSTDNSQNNPKNGKILELRKKINDLNQLYVDGGSKDEKLKATIENLRERLQIEMSTTQSTNVNTISAQEVNKLKTDRDDVKLKLKIAEANLESINSTLWSMKGNVSGQASKESVIANLEREVQRASEEYLQALDKFNMEKSKSLISGISLKPILMAQPAGEPESSKTFLKTFLAFFVSFIFCVIGVVLVEYLDMSIKTPAQFQRMTKLELAGVLNVIRNSNNLNLNQIFDEQDGKPDNQRFKHLIRKIRFEIENDLPQVILVTSTQEKVGKSFLIVCLAYSLSLINKRILIIDTNFRNNTLSKWLITKPSEHKLLKRAETMKSLGPITGKNVEGEDDEDESFKSIISKTAHQNIFVLGSKKSNESPSEILSGRRFGELLFDLKSNYDYIFLEGASLNDYSDTRELIGYADRVMPVFSAEAVIKEADRQSIRYLRTLNGKLIGSVLNKVSEKDLKV